MSRRRPATAPPTFTPRVARRPGAATATVLDDWPEPTGLAADSGSKRRAGRATVIGLWSAVGLALLLGLLHGAPKHPAAAATTASPSAVASAAPAAPVAPAGGCAQLMVAAWLAGDTATVRALTGVDPGHDLAARRRQADATQVMSVHAGAEGSWIYLVAASVRAVTAAGGRSAPTWQYFTVVLVPADGGCDGFSVIAPPAQTSGPQLARSGLSVDYSRPVAVSGSDLADTVARFFTALLTGGGDLDRYTTTDARISAVTPAPYSGVQVDAIAAHADAAGVTDTSAAPAEGAVAHLLVELTATAAGAGPIPLAYPVDVVVVGGRWQVAAIAGSPQFATVPAPTHS